AAITYVVQSPFMKSQRGLAGHILGGYELSGVTVFESGVPFTVLNGRDSDGIGGNTGATITDRPNVNPNRRRRLPALPQPNTEGFITGYVNPDDSNAAIDPSMAYFIGNPPYTSGLAGSVPRVGTLGRNTERTPGTNNFDVSILKRTRISESKTVEFRTEFYNIFNHPQYGQGSVSPFSPAGNPNNASFIQGSVNTSTAGMFLKANTADSDGGGRVIRYQLKFIF